MGLATHISRIVLLIIKKWMLVVKSLLGARCLAPTFRVLSRCLYVYCLFLLLFFNGYTLGLTISVAKVIIFLETGKETGEILKENVAGERRGNGRAPF